MAFKKCIKKHIAWNIWKRVVEPTQNKMHRLFRACWIFCIKKLKLQCIYKFISPKGSVVAIVVSLFCSVTNSYLTLCDPMDCTTSGFPVLLSPRICWNSCPLSVMLSNHLILCWPLSFHLQSLPPSESFLKQSTLCIGCFLETHIKKLQGTFYDSHFY